MRYLWMRRRMAGGLMFFPTVVIVLMSSIAHGHGMGKFQGNPVGVKGGEEKSIEGLPFIISDVSPCRQARM